METPFERFRRESRGNREQRQATLTTAFELNPIRFRRIAPQAPIIPEIVWINPPIKEVLANI